MIFNLLLEPLFTPHNSPPTYPPPTSPPPTSPPPTSPPSLDSTTQDDRAMMMLTSDSETLNHPTLPFLFT